MVSLTGLLLLVIIHTYACSRFTYKLESMPKDEESLIHDIGVISLPQPLLYYIKVIDNCGWGSDVFKKIVVSIV